MAGGNKGKKPVSARGVVDESFLPMFLGAGRATPVAAPARAPAKIPSKRQRKEALAQPLVLVQMPLPVPMPVEEEVEQAEQQPAAAWDEPQTGDGETAPGTEEEAPATADGTDDAHEGGPDDAQPSSAAADGPDDEGQAAAAAAGEEDDDEGGRSKRRRAHPPGRFDPQAYPPAKPRGRAKSKFDMLNKASTETLGQLHHLVPRLSDDGVAGWVGRVDAADGAPRAMETSWYRTPREAALAVDRYLYKLYGKEGCNYSIPDGLAIELDEVAIEEIEEELTKDKTTRYRGVAWSRKELKWQAYVAIRSRQMWLGSCITELAAAKRVSAAAFILGDRCSTPPALPIFSGLTREQGRPLAIQLLGWGKVRAIEKEYDPSLPTARHRRQAGSPEGVATAAAAAAAATDVSAPAPALSRLQQKRQRQAKEEEARREEAGAAAPTEEVGEAAPAPGPASGDSADATVVSSPHWCTPELAADVRKRITFQMVSDTWVDVWQGLVAEQAATGEAPTATGTGPGSAPHPAIVSTASALGLDGAEAVAVVAWEAAQAQAETYAAEMDDKELLDMSSLHRLTFLLAYSTLWLRQVQEMLAKRAAS